MRHLGRKERTIFLQRDSQRYQAKLNIGAVAKLSQGGWRRFVKANGIEVGDICLFELLKDGETCTMNVHIIRSYEVADWWVSICWVYEHWSSEVLRLPWLLDGPSVDCYHSWRHSIFSSYGACSEAVLVVAVLFSCHVDRWRDHTMRWYVKILVLLI